MGATFRKRNLASPILVLGIVLHFGALNMDIGRFAKDPSFPGRNEASPFPLTRIPLSELMNNARIRLCGSS